MQHLTTPSNPYSSNTDEGSLTDDLPTSLALANFPEDGGEPIPVPISYEIIQLFSEGLYQSPQKAIEELVTNGFDAGASNVRVILPSSDDRDTLAKESLFVIDDGSGIDSLGFTDLWAVARSNKRNQDTLYGRKPIGQFGIGKLAAYVLAWRLTHISKTNDTIRAVSMNFHRVSDLHQWDPGAPPIEVQLHTLDNSHAMTILGEIERRDPSAWESLFGDRSSTSWTVAMLSDFKNLYDKLSTRRLQWVLRSGLPLASNFAVYIDGTKLEPSKSDLTPLFTSLIGGSDDTVASKLDLPVDEDSISIPGIEGKVQGVARLYSSPLTRGKSDSIGRSHGFFIRVRGRIINLDDELFGLSPLSHGAWSRFAMEIDADGLHYHLLSSREGVKDNAAIRALREYMHEKFNLCRSRWIQEEESELHRLSLATIRGDGGGKQISGPLIEAVSKILEAPHQSSFYFDTPRGLDDLSRADFAREFAREAEAQPFHSSEGIDHGNHSPMARYNTEQRILSWNTDHPLVSYVRSQSKNNTSVELLAAAEVLTESLLHAEGISAEVVDYVLRQRDRGLRILVGAKPPIAARVLAELDIALEDKDALERAVGRAFQALGFEYVPKGGNKGGADGVLRARLGMQTSGQADFSIVYDAKSTDSTSVSSGKIDFAALIDFAQQENAQYGFFVAKQFDGETDSTAAINRRKSLMDDSSGYKCKLALLTVRHIKEILSLHLMYGLTLSQVRDMFEHGSSTGTIDHWIESMSVKLDKNRVPLAHLFECLEAMKTDSEESVNIRAAREYDKVLKSFRSDKLLSQIVAVEALLGDSWISVDHVSMNVSMHSSASQIVSEIYRCLDEEGIPIDPS